MKTNGSVICGSGGALSSGSYGAYANWMSNYIASLKNYGGINLYAISVQNEPDWCPGSYAGAVWSGQNIHDYVTNNLGPTLVANGQSAVKIMLPESSVWSSFSNLASTCMDDPACAAYVASMPGMIMMMRVRSPILLPHLEKRFGRPKPLRRLDMVRRSAGVVSTRAWPMGSFGAESSIVAWQFPMLMPGTTGLA